MTSAARDSALALSIEAYQQRIERVLIGHIQSHQGSIEATIA